MTIKPLQMPDLSQLPDPTKDMFGGMTSPTALMSMSDQQVEDIISPKYRPTQITKISDAAQRTIDDAARFNNSLIAASEKRHQQAMKAQQAARDAEAKAIDATLKEYARINKANTAAAEEAKKETAAAQGGKLGAGADGSFVLTSHAHELLAKPEWNKIVSNLHRDDEMEDWLKTAEGHLRAGGASEEAIKAELENARTIISDATKKYTRDMKSDRIDPTDLVTSLGKSARTAYRVAGILFGTPDKWAANEKDAINSINSTYSNTMLLDQANYAYTRSKSKARNPNEGLIGGFIQGVKDAWNSDSIITNIVDTAGYVPYAVVGTAVGAKALAGVGAASGLSGLTAATTGKIAATSTIGGRIAASLLSAETAAAAATSGVLSATDAAGGAYDSVMELDFKKPKGLAAAKANYIRAYGEANWNNLVESKNGDMDKVKHELATQAARSAGVSAFITTAPLGVFGLEAALTRIGTQGAAAQAGKRLLTVGANTVSETLEEGFTQLAQNIGTRPVTGVDLTDDVGATAAMGAIVGGTMAAGSQAAAAVAASDTDSKVKGLSSIKARLGGAIGARLQPTYDAAQLDASNWTSDGTMNYGAYREAVGHQMDNIARDARGISLSEEDVQQLQQRAFDAVVDNAEMWQRMTPDQRTEFKDYLRLSYNINTNGYARYQETDEARAWASGDYAAINNAVTDNPYSKDMLNAYRVKHNVELEQVPQNGRAYFKTLADVLDAMATKPTNVTTQEREFQAMQVIADLVKGNDKLTDTQKKGITMFTMNSLDAGSRRMTNEQQRDYDRVQAVAQRILSTNQQVSNDGTQEQVQAVSSERSGQGAVAQNVESVPSQGVGTGAGTGETLSALAAELATNEPAGQGSGHVEGTGNDPVGQAPVGSSQADHTATGGTGTGTDSQGLGREQNAGLPQAAPTVTGDSGQAAGQGAVGQASQSGQPLGQARPSGAEASDGSRGIGASPTERDSDGGSEQALTEADVTSRFLADPANEEYVKSFVGVAYNDLGKHGQGITKHKEDLRKLARITGIKGGKLDDHHIDRLYLLLNLPVSAVTTQINNMFRTAATINRVQNAVHYFRRNVLKAIKVDVRTGAGEARREQREAAKAAEAAAKRAYLASKKAEEEARLLAAQSTQAVPVGSPTTPDTVAERRAVRAGYLTHEQARAEITAISDRELVQTEQQGYDAALTIAEILNVPATAVADYILRSPLLADTLSDKDVIDLVLDAATNIWSLADGQTDTGATNEQGQATALERRGAYALNSPRTSQTGLSLPSPAGAPAATDAAGAGETRAGAEEVSTPEGETFNLQEILSGVTNKRIRSGEKPPTLNDLAPEDDTAARPTIELTIKGKTYTGKLYRFRQGNRRYIAFIHDGNAYGMKAVQDGVENQDWINFGAGVGTKRVDSINAQTALKIRVLDGMPSRAEQAAQQDLFTQPQEQNAPPQAEPEQVQPAPASTQEIENETKQAGRVDDGDQPTDTRAADQDGTDRVGDDYPSADGQGEVSGEGGRGDGEGAQAGGGEAANRPVGDAGAGDRGGAVQAPEVAVYPANLTRHERQAIAEIAEYEGVDAADVYQAIAQGNINFFTGSGVTHGADVAVMARELVGQEVVDSVAKGEELISRLTTAPVVKAKTSGNSVVDTYFDANPRDKATLEDYLAETRVEFTKEINFHLDKSAEYAESNTERSEGHYDTAARFQKALKALPRDAVEMANTYLTDDVVFADAVKTADKNNTVAFVSLPKAVKDTLARLWNSIKGAVAAVSVALAAYLGSNFAMPNTAMAATPTETAVVQRVVQTGDNQGKNFIVADKKAGTLTVYNASGVELTSTPALFGKGAGDSITTKNTTPSGRFELKRAANVDAKDYGASAQALTVDGQTQTNNAGTLAIHRVLTKHAKENRAGRLASPTAADNRISHGCINVPAEFYEQYMDGAGGNVLYVMPDTAAAQTGVFSAMAGVSDTQDTTAKPVHTPIAPAMDAANASSVEIPTADVQAATTAYPDVKQAPVKAMAPATIAGTQPSGQVAFTSPVVTGGITADQFNVPFEVHTPAELQANGVFDTEPVASSVRADGGKGMSIYDLAAWLAGLVTAGGAARVGRKKLKSKKSKSVSSGTPDAAQADVTEAVAGSEPLVNIYTQAEQAPPASAQALVDEFHNAVVDKSKPHVAKNLKAPVQKSPIADAVNRALWLEYLNESHLTAAKDADGNLLDGGETLNTFADSMLLFGHVLDNVMQDNTFAQATDGTFDNPLKWRNDIRNGARAGISAKLMNLAAGATQVFDNLMTEHGIARVGHEADSSIPSKHLAQVRAKGSGAYTQIHKVYVSPFVTKLHLTAADMRVSYDELAQDVGRVGTLNHVLNEAADAMWRGMELYIDERKKQLAAVNQAIADTADGAEIRLTYTSKARILQDDILETTAALDKARAMYNGHTAWDGQTGMPGGYTKVQAEQALAELKSKYGSEFSTIEKLAKENVQVIRGIRNYAAAAGVYSNADLQTFHDLGFSEYVPLFAEQKNPLDVDESEAYTKRSNMDEILADLPVSAAKSMGLTKDLSRYRREGATKPAADAFTNMKVFTMNAAGRVAQQGWLESVQQLYEGTVGKPISATRITDEATLRELNESHKSGKLPGLIRVRPGMEQYAGIDPTKLKPIQYKGHNIHGELVAFNYYFTEPAIQTEIYANTDLTETLATRGLRNVGSLTRFAARMMTTYKPVWNIYNWVRDGLERLSIMLMRPVKDKNGKLVNKWDMAGAYFKNLAVLSVSPSALRGIYRYLMYGETRTPMQATLHEAVGQGAINLITAQTEKHSVMADLSKSTVERVGAAVSTKLGNALNKTGLGKIKLAMERIFGLYVMGFTEVLQVTTGLAAYMAYQDMGVNKGETANRVRDQYDPVRVNNAAINNIATMFPFTRSTLSGHYNLARTLTEYWKPDTWQAPAAYILVGTLGTMATLTALSAVYGDDEDGVPRLARLPAGTLMNGIPVPLSGTGVWSAPVGFGMNKLSYGIGASLWRYSMGVQSGTDTAKQIAGLVVDNTSPMQQVSGTIAYENPAVATALTFVPLIAKPMMEIATNTRSYGGSKIIKRATPTDQYHSEQDNFNVPETYKTWARALRKTTGIDMRPETIRHLFESYSWGPLGAIPKSIIQDQSDKTLGNQQRKGEVFGPFLTAIGADMAISPNALDLSQQSFVMKELQDELHKKYGVGRTHSNATYEKYADRTKNGKVEKVAAVTTERAMRDKGVPENVIKYVTNGMRYEKARQTANKEFTNLSKAYYEARQRGEDDPQMRAAVQAAWDKLETLTNNYVKDNNRAYFEIMRQQ